MRWVLLAIFSFLLPASVWGSIPAELELAVPTGKIAKLRVYREMMDGRVRKQVLVGVHLIPEGSQVRITLNEPLLYQWLLRDDQKIVQSSMPYFKAKILALPEGCCGDEEQAILTGTFFVHIRDLDVAQIVAALYPEKLPQGVGKVPYAFGWDAYNPEGTWAASVLQGLRLPANQFLVGRPPRDVSDFCGRYETLPPAEREIFWLALFNEIVKHESAYIPLATTDEGLYDSGNKGIISSGLTQLSIASSRAACYQARGCDAVKGQQDLFRPDPSLRCSVGIMSCLTQSGGCLSCRRNGRWQGIAKYWSTMRDPYQVSCRTCPGGRVTIGKKKEIRAALRTTAPFCF